MKSLLFVAIGGGIGAVARFKLGSWVLGLVPDWKFPLISGRFNVDGSGCF